MTAVGLFITLHAEWGSRGLIEAAALFFGALHYASAKRLGL